MKFIEEKKIEKKYIFSVEGNIGAGKSTFLKKFSVEFPLFKIFFEPCSSWQKINNENLLDFFYKDKKRWAYSFESYVFMNRINELENIKNYNNKFFIMERSIFTNYYTFSRVCKNNFELNDLEWGIYEKFFEWMKNKTRIMPDYFIYLRASPKICMDRIKIRNRIEETNISIDYLSKIHDFHDKWLLNEKKIPVITLDVNKNFEEIEDNWNLFIFKIKDFFEKNFLF